MTTSKPFARYRAMRRARERPITAELDHHRGHDPAPRSLAPKGGGARVGRTQSQDWPHLGFHCWGGCRELPWTSGDDITVPPCRKHSRPPLLGAGRQGAGRPGGCHRDPLEITRESGSAPSTGGAEQSRPADNPKGG